MRCRGASQGDINEGSAGADSFPELVVAERDHPTGEHAAVRLLLALPNNEERSLLARSSRANRNFRDGQIGFDVDLRVNRHDIGERRTTHF